MRPQASLETILGYSFTRRELLEQALTHKSYANEQQSAALVADAVSAPAPVAVVGDNERLEFLGDAVLDLALSAELMNRFPTDPEGGLSKKRASLVNEDTLAKLAQELKLEELIRLGRGEQKTGGVTKPRILASSLEAVLGAVFLDGGFAAAVASIEKLFAGKMTEIASSDVDFRHDFKTRLQERVQELHKSTPTYKVEGESGPDHDKKFAVSVGVGENQLGLGTGKSKKAAEQDAARQALEKLI
jgi:ribonuclease-3